MSEEIFNEENPFIRPSPEDIAYYGLDKLNIKQKPAEQPIEEDDDDFDEDDDDNDEEEIDND